MSQSARDSGPRPVPDSGPRPAGQPARDTGEQLELMQVARPLFSATPSRLATFDCPRRYRFTYVERPAPPKGPPWAHNTVGAAVHVALARWFSEPPERRTPEFGATLVRRHWQHDGFADADQSALWREHAAHWVESYLIDERRRGRADDEPRGVERTVAMRTATLAVSGRVDRIDERDGELVIVDYKTGRYQPDDADAKGSAALALYAMAAERTLHRRCRRVELHHVRSGHVAVAEHTDESLARHLDRADQTVLDIRAATDTVAGGADPAEVFEPAPSPGCGWCDYRRLCPEGRAASSERAPWDGLGSPEDA